ncbi:MAG: ATP-binding protein [Eubacteriales bacterium]|nr:ATP-binding protein [Eubacteriales bacterium]
MAYDRALISSILRQLERQRDQYESEAEQRRYQLSQTIPRLSDIDRELRATAAKAMRIAFESDNTSEEIEALKQKNLMLQAEKRSLLLQHGYPADYLAVAEDCPQCHDQGYHNGRLCSCVKRKASDIQKKRLSSLLPVEQETFETFRLDYYSTQPDNRFSIAPREMATFNFQKCLRFADQFGDSYENLLLYGSAGLGKTFLSSCIARRVTERGFSVAYDTAIAIFDQYNSVKFKSGDFSSASQALERFHNADLLIIDDLGTEMPSAFHTSCLYDLLSRRLMRRLPTILSTNLLPDMLEERYSPAIASRILGEFTQLRFVGDDIRKLRKKQRL